MADSLLLRGGPTPRSMPGFWASIRSAAMWSRHISFLVSSCFSLLSFFESLLLTTPLGPRDEVKVTCLAEPFGNLHSILIWNVTFQYSEGKRTRCLNVSYIWMKGSRYWSIVLGIYEYIYIYNEILKHLCPHSSIISIYIWKLYVFDDVQRRHSPSKWQLYLNFFFKKALNGKHF